MWKYNHTDELYHYGVLGMKWGVRRGNTFKAYSKATRKLQKLEKKEKKVLKKSDKHASKSVGWRSATSLAEWHRKANGQMQAKARGYQLKGKKLIEKMDKAFKDVPVSKINKDDFTYVKKYMERIN